MLHPSEHDKSLEVQPKCIACVSISDSLLALALPFRALHSSCCATSVLCCINNINLSPGFRHSQYFSRIAKVTGIQRIRPQRKCVCSCSVCYFCCFGSMCMFLFLELEFSPETESERKTDCSGMLPCFLLSFKLHTKHYCMYFTFWQWETERSVHYL